MFNYGTPNQQLEPLIVEGLIIGLNLGILAGLIVYGGLDVIRHYVLRIILSLKGYAPLNYTRFLDYATKLIFLCKVGGGYIFIHRLFMEHFVAMGKERGTR